MEEIIIKKNKTNRKIYVNSSVKISSIPNEEVEKLALIYTEIVENLISKSMKRKQHENNKKSDKKLLTRP